MRLEGKVAIVTGGASGMGAATARRFGREGASVVVADVDEAGGRAVAVEIASAGGAAEFLALDVTDEDAWRAVVAATVERFGRLDVLVNNAGLSGATGGDMLDTALWDTLLAVNARGVFLGIKHALPELRRAGGGSIVNVSSISGIVGQHGVHMGYNASKGAIRTLTKAAAVQAGADGVRVNSVHPGIMPPMRSGKAGDPEFRERLLANVPLGRAGEVDEVANAILFLASDEASYVTGAELWVDGGYLAV